MCKQNLGLFLLKQTFLCDLNENRQLQRIYITISTNTSVCPSSVRRPAVSGVRRRHKIFFSLKSPWDHPLTTWVDPQVDPRVDPWVDPRVDPEGARASFTAGKLSPLRRS